MLLVDRKVYLVGYKKKDNDPWETSGDSWGDLTDAQWNAKEVSKHGKCITKVFVMDDITPVGEEIKNVE